MTVYSEGKTRDRDLLCSLARRPRRLPSSVRCPVGDAVPVLGPDAALPPQSDRCRVRVLPSSGVRAVAETAKDVLESRPVPSPREGT